ncbi:MAG: peptide-methionine (S)-S-oxide reductase MsrA [Paenibacillus dendritiformis]|uniref:peptide-methionine (S)-S-oxide reductase MsrA n=1 Tax=Paenibacillus dendritiformis TaxID=130049 RepID=UPI001B120EEA|nr:peptide-methionine (S)-S-oxide reductase MsrA [Paenibacillus dendritiformis]MDU5140898.1 peptide-methionine (S)-S-oxide reductase MsrA [Paenibacillus dendritiformis]GIO71634.1 peptide methionine sulfoxide reductase MsrA [Paenibacillus dendritiformis]
MPTYVSDASACQQGTPRQDGLQLATFAGGCFWCMVKPFDQWDGVHAVVSGYTGGHIPHPTYEQVKSQTTGHLEAVQITFDPAIIPYSQLLELYWAQIDPTDDGGQFQDRGESYTTAIFVHNEEQRRLAEASRTELAASGRFDRPIVTPIRDAGPFYPAEDYHQDYYRKEPEHYAADRAQSGRDDFLEKHWEK